MSDSRSYALEPGEPLPMAIARVARGRIDHAIDELSGEADSSPEEAVHNARKDMKKLRALLRLVRGEIGDEVYRRENAAFRDAAAELAGARDAEVMVATLDGLELDPALSGPVRQALEAHRLRTTGGTLAEAGSLVIEMLEEARQRVDEWPLERDSFAALDAGLERMYRRGRRDYRATRRERSVEGLHEWRKRTKELWYDHTLLGYIWPPVMDTVADEAHALSDRLGDDHDLAVLLEWSHLHAEPAPELVDAIERHRAELQADAIALGARLYAEPTPIFIRRIERWWSAAETPRAGRLAIPAAVGV